MPPIIPIHVLLWSILVLLRTSSRSHDYSFVHFPYSYVFMSYFCDPNNYTYFCVSGAHLCVAKSSLLHVLMPILTFLWPIFTFLYLIFTILSIIPIFVFLWPIFVLPWPIHRCVVTSFSLWPILILLRPIFLLLWSWCSCDLSFRRRGVCLVLLWPTLVLLRLTCVGTTYVFVSLCCMLYTVPCVASYLASSFVFLSLQSTRITVWNKTGL